MTGIGLDSASGNWTFAAFWEQAALRGVMNH